MFCINIAKHSEKIEKHDVKREREKCHFVIAERGKTWHNDTKDNKKEKDIHAVKERKKKRDVGKNEAREKDRRMHKVRKRKREREEEEEEEGKERSYEMREERRFSPT